MIYEIRLKGRQKQGECSAILTVSFFVTVLTSLSENLIPLVYIAAVKPMLAGTPKEKTLSLVFSLVLLIVSMVINRCLSLGVDRFMLKRAEDTVAGAGDIFYYFAPKRTFHACAFLVRFNICRLLIFSMLSLPFVLGGFVLYSLCLSGFSAVVCSVFAVFSCLFLVLAIVTFRRINDTFFLVRYRYIKGQYLNFRHLISESQQDMLKKTTKLRKLKGSFVGWFLLCFTVLPLPYVWCYYRQTKACFSVEE